MKATWNKTSFGFVKNNEVFLFQLENKNGMRVRMFNFGAAIQSVEIPDKNGNPTDVVLGYDSLEGYVHDAAYFGSVVGRYANRIAHGKFTLDNQTFTLATNNAPGNIPCHLHGGKQGFNKKVWDAEPLEAEGKVGLKLTYTSLDGEEGYPGELVASVTYWLTDTNAIEIQYKATTTKKTHINLTQHSYFNLNGQGTSSILDHVLQIKADKFTPVDKGLIPTGTLQPVQSTPFDFTRPTSIGERIDQQAEQLLFGMGYDHNWVLNNWDQTLRLAATVFDPDTGIELSVHTTEPGLQFYAGNFLDGSIIGKAKKAYEKRTGFCLETQHFPDSPNQPGFPSTVLEPDKTYTSKTVFQFGIHGADAK